MSWKNERWYSELSDADKEKMDNLEGCPFVPILRPRDGTWDVAPPGHMPGRSMTYEEAAAEARRVNGLDL